MKIMVKRFLIILLITFTPVSVFAADPPPVEKPLYGENGRPNTVEFMKEHIKPEIDRTLNFEAKSGKYYEKYDEALDKLKETQTEMERLADNPEAAPNFDQHPFFRGTTAGQVTTSHLHDERIILGDPANFLKCMDYEIIGICVPPGPVITKLVPYVKYYAPVQKVENVDQPLKTGYLTKTEVSDMMDDYDTEFYNLAADIAYDEMAIANWALSKQLGSKYADPGPLNAEYMTKAVKDLKDNFVKDKPDKEDKEDKHFRYLDQTANTSGYVYNEYHVMPSGVDLYQGAANALALTDPMAQLAMALAETETPFIHQVLSPGKFFSDAPENFLLARWSGATWFIFDKFREMGLVHRDINIMEEKWRRPYDCQKFNVQPHPERFANFDKETADDRIFTPDDMLTGLVDGVPADMPDYCLGANQDSWIPFTNMVHTTLHTTAAAVGTVRGIKAALYASIYAGLTGGIAPGQFYDFSLDHPGYYLGFYNFHEGQPGIFGIAREGDKVQWSKGEFMDGEPASGESKPCRPIERWALKYGDGNMKKILEDHQNVTIHWRYMRGCLGGGFPIWPDVPQVLQ